MSLAKRVKGQDPTDKRSSLQCLELWLVLDQTFTVSLGSRRQERLESLSTWTFQDSEAEQFSLKDEFAFGALYLSTLLVYSDGLKPQLPAIGW